MRTRHSSRGTAAIAFRIATCALVPLLSGCVGLVLKGTKTASSQITIESNRAAADAGNARAQYVVGAAYCCSIGPVDPAHDTRKATQYLCMSAVQDYAQAQYLLGRIYAGHPVSGFDPQQSAKLVVASAPKNLPIAAMWLTRAAQNGNADARDALNELTPKLSPAQLAEARADLANWRSAPCRWEDVIVASR